MINIQCARVSSLSLFYYFRNIVTLNQLVSACKKGDLKTAEVFIHFFFYYILFDGHYKCQQYNTLIVFINEINHLHYETCAHTTLTILLVNKTNKQQQQNSKDEKKRKRDSKRRAKMLMSSMPTFLLTEGETRKKLEKKKKDMVFKNLEAQSTSTQTKNIYVLRIKSIKEFHENSTKCDAIFAQSTDFGETNYSTAIQPYVLQQLRYEDQRDPGRSKTLPKLPQTDKGAIYRQISR